MRADKGINEFYLYSIENRAPAEGENNNENPRQKDENLVHKTDWYFIIFLFTPDALRGHCIMLIETHNLLN